MSISTPEGAIPHWEGSFTVALLLSLPSLPDSNGPPHLTFSRSGKKNDSLSPSSFAQACSLRA